MQKRFLTPKSEAFSSRQPQAVPAFTTNFFDFEGNVTTALRGKASIVRIVQAFKNPNAHSRNRWAKAVLHSVIRSWPTGLKARYLITSGGFLSFGWPQDLTVDDPGHAPEDAIRLLKQQAVAACQEVLTPFLRRKLGSMADYVSLGADSKRKDERNSASVEIVVLLDLHSNRTWITGKSYPTGSQEPYLVRFNDLSTHRLTIGRDRVLLLGCHDLNMYSNRSLHNAKGWRARQSREMRQMTSRFAPTVALQHPHYTHSPHSWSTALGGLRELVAKARVQDFTFASAGRWCNPERKSRRPLESCLRATAQGNVVTAAVRRAK